MDIKQRLALTLLCTVFLTCTAGYGASDELCSTDFTSFSMYVESDIDVTDSRLDENEVEIRQRILNTVTIVAPVYNPLVKSYLHTYIERNPQRTEEMLGRTTLYFPLFEQLLREEGLPDELKYLAVVESALVTYAKSRSGAVGLWQFMKPTAREYGLKITSYVDERMDTENATRAALKYLKKLYNRFGSWELAMAAYNAGPGRVSSAIRRSGSSDYWTMSTYLPRETRAYVPGFIAASYIYNHHGNHGLVPVSPSEEWNNLAKIRIHKGMSFTQISDVTGVPYSTIQELNKKYFRNYIPESVLGYDVFLPDYATPYLVQYLNAPDGTAISYHNFSPIATEGGRWEERDVAHTYFVKSGDNLYTLARNHGTSVRQIQQWNGLNSSNLRIGQRLTFYAKEMVMVAPKRRMVQVTKYIPVKARLSENRGDIFVIPPFECPITEGEFMSDQNNCIVIQRRHGLRNQLMSAGIENADELLESSNILKSGYVQAGRILSLKY